MLPIGSVLAFLYNLALIIIDSVKMIKEIFGKVVREIRLEKDLTQEKVAEIADLDRTYIYRLEQGQREPSLSTFFKISKGLQITPEELISRVEVNRKSEERKLKKKS